MNIKILLLAIIGILLSLYALWVEKNINENENYKSVCDINELISCTKPIKSDYAKFLGIPYGLFGLFFYLLIAFLAVFNITSIIFYLSCLAVIVSFILAYILYMKIGTFCIICSLLYCINLALLVFSCFP